ncbi:uncharacterized protein BDW70DRAFT_164919 [Aspergillus foveolatus]|uniref:uncharacterized protein n=1 Tax=Aspergillus foveolatus TaxID=210207 RepID=UPI003CCD155B
MDGNDNEAAHGSNTDLLGHPLEAVRRAGVPKEEEWKMTAKYKNSSISLSKLEATGSMQSVTSDMERMSVRQGADHMSYMSQKGHASDYHNLSASKAPIAQSTHHHPPSSVQQPLVAPVAASIPRYCFDNDKYWYIIEIALLTQFDEEAVNRGKPRTLPSLPGPDVHITDASSDGGRHNWDEYIKRLLAMPPHITQFALVRQLFAPRPGDLEIDPSAFREDAQLSGGFSEFSKDSSYMTASGGRSSGLNKADYGAGHMQKARPIPEGGHSSRYQSNSKRRRLSLQEPLELSERPRTCSWELLLFVASIPQEQRLTFLLKSVTLTMSENGVRALLCEDIIHERYHTDGIDLVGNIVVALGRNNGIHESGSTKIQTSRSLIAVTFCEPDSESIL